MGQRNFTRRAMLGYTGAGLVAAGVGECGVSASEPPAGVADRLTYLSDFCAAARVKWPGNRTLRVACHGHSVPAGYFKTPVVRTFDAYPHLLHVALAGQFPFAVINVIVTAIGGETSPPGARRFERDVLSLRPDVVTIDYGLNDRGPGLEAAHQAWTLMIEAAKRAGVKVLLLTPTPDQGAKFGDATDPLNRHAAQIKSLAATHGVGLVDSLAAFTGAVAAGKKLPELMSQGNHPNRAGHELVARKLAEFFPR